MSLIRPARAPRRDDRYLPHKMLLFVIGAGFGLAGIVSGREWLINIGIVVLVAGVLLRFARDRRPDDTPDGR